MSIPLPLDSIVSWSRSAIGIAPNFARYIVNCMYTYKSDRHAQLLQLVQLFDKRATVTLSTGANARVFRYHDNNQLLSHCRFYRSCIDDSQSRPRTISVIARTLVPSYKIHEEFLMRSNLWTRIFRKQMNRFSCKLAQVVYGARAWKSNFVTSVVKRSKVKVAEGRS